MNNWSQVCKRGLSFILALVMVFAMLPAGGGVLTAKAAEGDVTVHYYNDSGWAAVYGYVWESTGSDNTWPGIVLTENAEHTGWYDLTVTDTDGTFNCLFNNGSGSQTSDIAVDHSDGTTEYWYVNGTLLTAAPDSWSTGETVAPKTITVHYKNADSWSTVYGYVWESTGSNNTWPGVELTENAEHTGWYDLTVIDTDGAFNCIFTNNSGSQTSDIAVDHSDGTTEYWYVNGTLLTAAPDSWSTGETVTPKTITVHYKNADSWTAVYGYVWESTGSNNTWPGVELTENADHAGWYDLTVTDTDGAFNCIFTNNSGSQTADIAVDHSDGTAEFWYSEQTLSKSAPEEWNPSVDEGSVTVHYYNVGSWTSVYGYVWESTGSNNTWPGVVLTENADHAGWYDLTVTDTDGVFNCIFDNNSGGQTADIAVDHSDGTKEFWYVNGELLKAAPDSWTSGAVVEIKTVTVHFNNASSWSTVYGYVWNSTGSSNSWPGVVLTENADNAGWYDLTVIDVDGSFSCIFNNNSGSQTVDITVDHTDGTAEFWYASEQLTDTAPEGWSTGEEPAAKKVTVHYHNTTDWSAVYGYVWNSGDSDNTWPGDVLTENTDHEGWYDLTVTDTDTAFSCIFNSGSGSQTGDIAVDHSDGTTEYWYENEQLLTAAPESWTGGEEPPASFGGTVTMHFYNSQNWGAVKAHLWNTVDSNTSWPGEDMTANAANSGWYDMTVAIEADNAGAVFNNGEGTQTLDVTIPKASEIWIIPDALGSDGKWSVTVSYAAPDGWVTQTLIHFENTVAWNSVLAHLWNTMDSNTSWPGAAMTANSGNEGWYDITITVASDAVAGAVFNNGSGTQTVDVSVPKVSEVWISPDALTDGKWTVTSTDTAPDGWVDTDANEPLVGGLVTVADLVQVKIDGSYYTMAAFTNGVHETTVSLTAGDHTVVLVVNGAQVTEEATYTVETEGDRIFRLQNEELTMLELDKASVTGNFSALGGVDGITDWTPAASHMDYVGNGWYIDSFAFNSLGADASFEYKITFNDGWDNAIDNGSGGNRTVTVPAGTTQLTVLVDTNNSAVYTSVELGDLNTSVSMIGDIRGYGDGATTDWATGVKGWEFDRITDTLYRYEMDLSAGSYNYKCVFNYSAWYEKEGTGNRSFTLTGSRHVIFLYDTETGYLYDSINNPKEVALRLGMSVPVPEMEVIDNANGTTTFVALGNNGKTVTLYYGNQAEVEEKGSDALTAVEMPVISGGSSTSEDIFLGDEALDILYYYEIGGVRTLDTSNPIVTVGGVEYSNYTRDAFTGRQVNVPGTFPGPSWDAASNQMTYEGNGLYSYTFEDVPAANYEYKIAMGSWSENYGLNGVSDGSNISVTVSETQDVTIWYNDFSHNSVNSIEYIFAEISLTGTGIPEGTMLTDTMLTGIYSATVSLTAGTYDDIKLVYEGEEYPFVKFELTEDKDVTFYFDPSTGIYYHNGSDEKVSTDAIYFDSKDTNYKSVFGAVATGEEVTFTITTGEDAAQVMLVVKGLKTFEMEVVEPKVRATEQGTRNWSCVASFDIIGEYDYYFAISNGSDVKVYGDDDGYYGTGKVCELTEVMPYDLVVYRSGYETPDWMKNAVIYQIFPDRFFDGNESNNQAQLHARGAVNYEYVTDWYALPENPEQEALLSEGVYKATGAYYGDGEWSNEIYGGDLDGITQKIDYLKALGVNVIYLNPVFSSISNHRYDACDYTEIDPILGTLGDFTELVSVAEANGMHVILDGVFNHVSDDSIYFDRYYRFLGTSEKVGAYPYWAYVYDYMADNENATRDQAENEARKYFSENYGITDFSYTEWFDVFSTYLTDDSGNAVSDSIGLRAGKPVYGYDGWWGYDSMPIIKSTNGSEYQTGTWAQEIISGGDSVNAYWISKGMDGWRLDVANEVSDETWINFRASVKALNSDAVIIGEIWNDATKYLKGDMYDSVMNYLFRNAVTGFAMGTGAESTMNELERIRERYPEEAFYAMMNLVASHDTSRVLSYLDGIGDDRADKSISGAFPTYASTSELAKNRQYLVAFLQFTYPGAPTIYYGDEIGMVGADDPDDRRAMTWGKGNQEIVEWYAQMAAIRNAYPALRTGDIEPLDLEDDNLLAYLRSDDTNTLIVIANNASSDKTVTLPISRSSGYVDLVSGETFTESVTVPGLRGVVLVPEDQVKEITVNTDALKPAYDASYIVAQRSAQTTPSDTTYTAKSQVVENSDGETEVQVSVNALVNTFAGSVMVDGVEVDASNYTVKSGTSGTVVTLKAEFVDTLALGEHTVVISFNGGNASTTFTLEEKESEPTNKPTEKPEETSKPTEKPEETTKATETTQATEEATTKPTKKPNTNNANTGDDNMIHTKVMVMLLSAAGLVWAFCSVYAKRKARHSK